MIRKNKILIFSASALHLAVLVLLLFTLGQNKKEPDENGMFQIEGMWFEQQKEITPENAKKFADKINTLQTEYLTAENKVFYAIVPDKSYYIPQSGYPVPEYTTAFQSITSSVKGTYMDLTQALSLADYYHTDPHWRQEKLQGVADALGVPMGFKVDLSTYTQKSYSNFMGSYGKKLSGKLVVEPLYWLESPATQAASCQVFAQSGFEAAQVYVENQLTGQVPYNIFLSGASPLIRLENLQSKTEKELVVFRDSYASALAPLLLEHYRKITLVDLRYMVSALLPEYIELNSQDILFLYSTTVIADSGILR